MRGPPSRCFSLRSFGVRLGARSHGRRVFVRLPGVRRRQPGDWALDGPVGPRPVMELGVALLGCRPASAPADEAALASLLTLGVLVGGGSVCLAIRDNRCIFQLVRSPAGARHEDRVLRRRRGLDVLASLGAALSRKRAGGRPAPRCACSCWSCWRRSTCCCGIAPRIWDFSPMATRWPSATRPPSLERRRSRLGRRRLDAARAMRTARFWWISVVSSPACSSGTRCRFTRPNFCSRSASARVAAWALEFVSLLGIPGQISLGHLSDRIGREWMWAIGCPGFAICFGALIALKCPPVLPLVYLMVFAQGTLGYGMTSVVGAVVPISFKAAYGSIFGALMVAAWAAAPRGPGRRAAVRCFGQLHLAFRSPSPSARFGPCDLAGLAPPREGGRGTNAQGAHRKRRRLPAMIVTRSIMAHRARGSMSNVFRSTSAPSRISTIRRDVAAGRPRYERCASFRE